MKCQTCQNKQTTWGLGFCKKCGGNVPSSGYRYCDNCSQQLQQCQVCGTGMGSGSSSSSSSSGPTPYTTKVTTRDNGSTVKGVRTGEHVEITLDEDQHSGKEWAVKSKDWQFSTVSSGQFTQNPRNPQYGTRTFVFSCSSAGIGEIELHEVTRSYGYGWGGGGGYSPAPGGQTFKVSVEVS
jgi:hypothetical protein